MNLQHEQIFRRALQSRNPQAVLNVAQIFHGMGEMGKAQMLVKKLKNEGFSGPTAVRLTSIPFFASPHRQRFGFGVDYFAVQKKLNDLGVASPALVIDGNWGPKSKAALTAYQKSKGLTADGIPGPITLGSLGLTGTTSSTLTPASTSSTSTTDTGTSSLGPLLTKMKWPIVGAIGTIALVALLA